MSLSQTSVLKLYNTVVEDVINGVRESFLDEGVDEQVLQELKQIWESKLMSSKAVELNPDPPEPQPPQLNMHRTATAKKPANSSNFAGNSNVGNHFVPQQHQPQQMQQQQTAAGGIVLQNQHQQQQQQAQVPLQMTQQQATQQHQLPTQSQVMHPHGQNMPVQHQTAPVQQMLNAAAPTMMERPVPIQIKLPVHGNLPERSISILIPASAIQGNQLSSLLTGPVISAAMSLPASYATSLLQQHVNSTFEGHAGFTPIQVTQPVQVVSPNSNLAQQQLIQGQPQSGMSQLDGNHVDSTEEEEEDEEEDENEEDDDIDDKEEEENGEAAAREEEPLNSEDDVTDDDPTDLFDTDNVVVCQYDKITRIRNKWKLYLKDGIMNLGGKDYVFQKANGDAEW